MEKTINKVSGVIAIAGIVATALISGCQKEQQILKTATESEVAAEQVTWEYIPGQYIVVFDKAQIGNPQQKIGKNPVALKDYISGVTKTILEQQGIGNDVQVQNVYANTINGFAGKMSESALEALRKDNRIAYIQQDIMITLGRPGSGGGSSGPQVIPPGMDSVHWANYGGSNVAWIIDTGIDLDHPDLNVNKSKGFNAFTTGIDGKSLDDLNGHGSHVAGIVAAKNNEIGVVGVAAGATVIPVKVLNQSGSGSYSGVIAGVDFVAAHGASGDVANMSLGGPVYQALDDAILIAAANGIKFTLAAGNEKDDANNHSPSRTNGTNVYTISAMDKYDVWASFSNYGTSVDYCAPGVSIYSTYKNGGYATLSGTSMAAPHACGVLLHGSFSTNGTVSGDPDGNPDPCIVH